MNTLSAKIKIYVVIFFWVLVCAAMPMYFFPILEASNQELLVKINEGKSQIAALKQEQESFQKAKKDLDNFSKEKYQPEEFFKNEINIVEQLRTLESLAPMLGITVTLSGLSGTVKGAPKASTQSDVAQFPYSFTAVGDFAKVVDFMEIIENTSFVVHVTSVSISPADTGKVNIAMSAFLYLRRK